MIPALVLVNPVAGRGRGAKRLGSIESTLRENGYEPTVYMTKKPLDGAERMGTLDDKYALVVCVGGDGTLSEVVSGLVRYGKTPTIAYLPTGSTNDFARSLKLKGANKQALAPILSGAVHKPDAGRFNEQVFTYVASFGALAKVTYTTPQRLKNRWGYLSYLYVALGNLRELKPVHMRVETDDAAYEDDYLIGTFSNATSIGGVLRLSGGAVDMQDGLLEVLLVKYPKSIRAFLPVVKALIKQDYEHCEPITFCHSAHVRITTDPTLAWSLDGERGEGAQVIDIQSIPGAYSILAPKG